MADDIKFNSTSRELLSLRKGNIYLGVGDSPKGPTSLTGFKSTLNLATASTIIALHRGDGAFSWYRNYSDEELISRTNRIDNSVQRTTKEQCYSYFSSQSDKIILNRDYEKIITDNLVLNVDAGFLPSYPATGSIWYDTGSESHGTLENSPTYNTSGWLSFNGTNQLVNFSNILSFSSVNSFTIELWFLWDGTSLTPDSFYHLMGVGQNYYQLVIDRSSGNLCRVSFRVNNNDIFINTGEHDIYSNTWNHVVATYQPGVESKIYLNGVLKNTGSGVSTLQSSGNIFTIGGIYIDGTWFPGSISIARVYTKVLSDTEVLNNFNNQQVRYNVTTTTSTTTSGVTTTTSTTTFSGGDPDATSFINAAAPLTAGEQTAIINLVSALKSNNIWEQLTIFYPFVGTSANQHKLNLINPADTDAAHRITFTGSWDHSQTSNGNSAGLVALGIDNRGDVHWNTNKIPGNSVKLWFGVQPLSEPLGTASTVYNFFYPNPWFGNIEFNQFILCNYLGIETSTFINQAQFGTGSNIQVNVPGGSIGTGVQSITGKVIQAFTTFASKTDDNTPQYSLYSFDDFNSGPFTSNTTWNFSEDYPHFLGAANLSCGAGSQNVHYLKGTFNCFFLSDKDIGTVNTTTFATMKTILNQFRTDLGR